MYLPIALYLIHILLTAFISVFGSSINLRGVVIDDNGLKEEASKLGISRKSKFIILGDISISDAEAKYLEVHFKCREIQKLRRTDLETEITKLQTKHRYLR